MVVVPFPCRYFFYYSYPQPRRGRSQRCSRFSRVFLRLLSYVRAPLSSAIIVCAHRTKILQQRRTNMRNIELSYVRVPTERRFYNVLMLQPAMAEAEEPGVRIPLTDPTGSQYSKSLGEFGPKEGPLTDPTGSHGRPCRTSIPRHAPNARRQIAPLVLALLRLDRRQAFQAKDLYNYRYATGFELGNTRQLSATRQLSTTRQQRSNLGNAGGNDNDPCLQALPLQQQGQRPSTPQLIDGFSIATRSRLCFANKGDDA